MPLPTSVHDYQMTVNPYALPLDAQNSMTAVNASGNQIAQSVDRSRSLREQQDSTPNLSKYGRNKPQNNDAAVSNN
jgi:hypothetical protein